MSKVSSVSAQGVDVSVSVPRNALSAFRVLYPHNSAEGIAGAGVESSVSQTTPVSDAVAVQLSATHVSTGGPGSQPLDSTATPASDLNQGAVASVVDDESDSDQEDGEEELTYEERFENATGWTA